MPQPAHFPLSAVTYAPMSEALGVRFSPFVVYTYGGFHKSALSFIDQMGTAYDPAVVGVSLSAWKEELKDRIAVCLQRHTANIVIEDARQARVAGIVKCRRSTRRSRARRRPRSSVLPSQRHLAEWGLREVGTRAVSLCAPLLASSVAPCPAAADSDGNTVLLSAQSAPLASGPLCEAVVPGTLGIDDASLDATVCVRALSELCTSHVCVDEHADGMEVCGVDVASAAVVTDVG